MVLVQQPREDPTHQQDPERLGLQPVEQVRTQEDPAAGQRRVRHQPDDRVLPVGAEQRVQRRYRLARRCLLPREARRLRGLRGAAELRGRHEPRNSSVIPPLPPNLPNPPHSNSPSFFFESSKLKPLLEITKAAFPPHKAKKRHTFYSPLAELGSSQRDTIHLKR
uniref:(northern house mosquito) hypothetical protein n=1 Tax=Culex pipiens TaxID=7175 RepID=A0A8D8IJE2_CULPI